jgi:hypothetical protein
LIRGGCNAGILSVLEKNRKNNKNTVLFTAVVPSSWEEG